MTDEELNARLSRISTMWTVLRQAHEGSETVAQQAQQQLMQRYSGAIFRYLLAAVRDRHQAEELTQEFALRFIQGRFHLVSPERGRFRDYVKTALFHMVSDLRRQQQRAPKPTPIEEMNLPAAEDFQTSDALFYQSWRQTLLDAAWEGLKQREMESGQPYYQLLRFKVQHPEARSADMAELFGQQLQRPLTAGSVRKIIERARKQFAQLILDETRTSLGPQSTSRLEDELIELNLLKYCQEALDQDSPTAD